METGSVSGGWIPSLKLNGHRIEPVEIATVMLQSGLAKEAAVVPIMKDGIPRFLRGAVVPKKEYQEKGDARLS